MVEMAIHVGLKIQCLYGLQVRILLGVQKKGRLNQVGLWVAVLKIVGRNDVWVRVLHLPQKQKVNLLG